jgi:uncharacterized protein YceH (UPF0502 family)
MSLPPEIEELIASNDRVIAEKDRRIAELEAEVAALRRRLGLAEDFSGYRVNWV